MSYMTINGKLHIISEDSVKWLEFYYLGKDGIENNDNSQELVTSYINGSQYDKQYFLMNLSAGDLFTAYLSWDGNGKVYIAYVEGIDFQSDKNDGKAAMNIVGNISYYVY